MSFISSIHVPQLALRSAFRTRALQIARPPRLPRTLSPPLRLMSASAPPPDHRALSAVDVHERITKAAAVYVDVRTPAEFAEAHIPTAINVSLTTPDMKPRPSFVDDFRAAVGDASEIIVGCKSGTRSSMAISQLQQAGFNNLLELQGGFTSWLDNSQLPVAK